MELITEIIGYTAAFFGTILMLPQAYKSYKTKRVDDVSIAMVIVYLLNCLLWGVYGYFIKSGPILYCNIIALAIGIFQFYLKLRYQTKGSK